MYGYLSRTPAALIGVSLADAVGDRRTQNQPGTTDEYPNWRGPPADAAGPRSSGTRHAATSLSSR